MATSAPGPLADTDSTAPPSVEKAGLELLHRLGRSLAQSLDVHDIAQRALDDICAVTGATQGVVYLLESDSDRLRLVAASGHEETSIEELDARLDIRLGRGLSGWVAAHRQAALVEDIAHDERWLRVPGMDERLRSALSVPLISRDELIGTLGLGSEQPAFFGPAHLQLAESVAATVAVAVTNARLVQAERKQRQVAEALAEAAAVVNSNLYLDDVLDRILEQVERVVAGDAFNIMLIEGADRVRIVRWRGYENLGVEEQVAAFSMPVHEYPTLLQMAQTGAPILIADTTSYPDWKPAPGWEWLRSLVAAPIQVTGMTVGYLNVDGTRPGQFGPDDVRRLGIFVHHAATAVENASLYQELRNYAESLERRVQERKAQLQAQYARLEAILYSTTDGILVTDAEGRILQANPVAQRWLTRTLVVEDAEQLQKTIRDLARRAGERPEAVLELKGLDLQLSAAPVATEGAEGTTVVVIHDVSHLRALERMKSRFVSNVSHELRTPITTIKLYAALLRRSPPEKWESYIDALTQEADRQARLLEDILQVSHIDTGSMSMKSAPMSLNTLVDRTMASYQILAQEHGLTMETHLADPGPTALVDPDRITWVLGNLLSNAIRYTPEGGRVTIATGKQEAESRTWATVTVSDTGMGIPEEELPHIFERFFRGEKPRQMQVPGTGLGLAIVKEIVELHGGRVTVESQVGAGTTFTVWLPLAE